VTIATASAKSNERDPRRLIRIGAVYKTLPARKAAATVRAEPQSIQRFCRHCDSADVAAGLANREEE
jgi:hypothetical protein